MKRTEQSLREERDLFISMAVIYEAERGVLPVDQTPRGYDEVWRGLCGWMNAAVLDEPLFEETAEHAQRRLRDSRPPEAPSWWWPRPQVAPRVRHLLTLAERCHWEANR